MKRCTRIAVISLTLGAIILLAGCGGSGYEDLPKPKNTNPHHGWVSLGGNLSYRCIGVDKVIQHNDPWSDESYEIVTVKDSEDCK